MVANGKIETRNKANKANKIFKVKNDFMGIVKVKTKEKYSTFKFLF